MLESTLSKRQTAFDGPISRMDWLKKRIINPEDLSRKLTKLNCKKKELKMLMNKETVQEKYLRL